MVDEPGHQDEATAVQVTPGHRGARRGDESTDVDLPGASASMDSDVPMAS
ncbi:hypothetical protein V2J94_29725 [Streptomyces sp. DSM 41524]|uniref:Uncharacterized protein n=1 Tax=Streptomyces asiaticus subsp. ignotus TaxID=3098222 RepID=A0ABU7Q3S3_9ACTN|nr:hypothetical protein [Streptomyces sp. DSM 41524]